MADRRQVEILKEGLAELVTSSELADVKIKRARLESSKLKAIGTDEDDAACDDPEMVSSMMRYFYYLDYEDKPAAAAEPATNPMPSTPAFQKQPPNFHREFRKAPAPAAPSGASAAIGSAVLHAKAFAIATKFQVKWMCELASKRFAASMEHSWDKEDFAPAIYIVFTCTPEVDDGSAQTDLRAMVVQTLLAHSDLLLKPEVDVAMKELHGLCYRFVREQAKQPPKANKTQASLGTTALLCNECGKNTHASLNSRDFFGALG